MTENARPGVPPVTRRRFLYGAAATALGVGAWRLAPAGAATAAVMPVTGLDGDHPVFCRTGFQYPEGRRGYVLVSAGRKTVRKSASSMSRHEIDRFSRAFTWAVSQGYLDVFNDEHFDHMRNRNHGVDVEAGSPPAGRAGEAPSWGHRLLPWHRSFLLEAEQMLRAALHDRNRHEGRDPDEAHSLFLPYWDMAHDQDLPGWVKRLRPRGGTAIVPEGLPRGHAGYGKPVGSRYRIRFGRWPASFLVFDKLPPADQITRVLNHDNWLDFYNAIDVLPEIVQENLPAAAQALAGLKRRIPDDPNLQIVLASIDPSYPKDPRSQLAAFNAFLAVGHLANLETVKRSPDRELIGLIKSLYSVVRFPPHLVPHFWAAGLDPRNPHIRGTVSYFNELTVDPVFWMLHGGLDWYWYTWEATHDGRPPLAGDDAVFQPLLEAEGDWYGGGRAYQLDELVDHRALPYEYERTFRQ